jgi:hypothetical protein
MRHKNTLRQFILSVFEVARGNVGSGLDVFTAGGMLEEEVHERCQRAGYERDSISLQLAEFEHYHLTIKHSYPSGVVIFPSYGWQSYRRMLA